MILEPKFTIQEIQEYFKGWNWSEKPDEINLASLSNAYIMLDDPQDGIVAWKDKNDSTN